MATGTKVEGVAPPSIPAGIRKTIQSIKEIVGNHSDGDVYAALKEANMDPNETTQKLLHQDPFHEVKRKRSRNKEKENVGNKGPAEDNKNQQEKVAEFVSFDQNKLKGDNYKMSENSQRGGFQQRGGGVRRGGDFKRGDGYQRDESVHKVDGRQKSEEGQRDSGFQKDEVNQRDGHFQRGDFQFQRGSSFRRGGNFYRGGNARNLLPVKPREFRVVRDNRVNKNTSQDSSALHECSFSDGKEAISDLATKGDSSETLINLKAAEVKGLSAQKVHESKGSDEQRLPFQGINTQRQAGKPKDNRPRSAGHASNNFVLGVYSSSSDPVHVPPPTRSSANGSFRREVGVVGVRKTPTDNATSAKRNSSEEAVRPRSSPKDTQIGSKIATEPVVQVVKVNRPLSSNNQHVHRSYQHPAGHQKVVQRIKEWKPKSSKKNAISVEVASALPAAEFVSDGLTVSNIEDVNFSDKHNSEDNKGVIIPDHIRVPDIERCRVTFGSFGLDTNLADSITGSQTVEGDVEFGQEHSTSLPESASYASNANKVASHESTESPASGAVVDHPFSETKDSSSPQNMENYSEIGLVQNDSASYTPELQKQQDAANAGSFSIYDPQTGYPVTYIRHSVDEANNDGLPSAQEGFNMHAAGMIPASQALYQQQAQVGQMYPQVHVSHYMPYRQLIPPVYVPPMGMPGYSANPGYAHPVNGSGYMLMPGGTSHLSANAMKYGVQPQFKPSPGGSPTGFENYAIPNGYMLNAPGGMMGTSGVDDTSRVKYKDANLYVQNPQAEGQEMWMQNSREMSGLQHPHQYYNMQGQAPHGTYMPGHHAAAQTSHMQYPSMQYPNMYHAQAAAMGNHIGQVNVGVAQPPPMAQVRSYQPQQPQMNSHLQWTSNTF